MPLILIKPQAPGISMGSEIVAAGAYKARQRFIFVFSLQIYNQKQFVELIIILGGDGFSAGGEQCQSRPFREPQALCLIGNPRWTGKKSNPRRILANSTVQRIHKLEGGLATLPEL